MEIVDSLDERKSSRSALGKDFPNFEIAGREDCLGSEQDHPEFPDQKEGQPRRAESPKRGPVSARRQIAFTVYDYFRVTGAHDAALDDADLFSVTLHMMTTFRNSIRDGNEVL